MQLLAKFKKILYMGFRATLNFRKFKVALNPSDHSSTRLAAARWQDSMSRGQKS